MRENFRNLLRTSIVALALATAIPSAAAAGEMEDAVLAEVNFARVHPQAYAQRLLAEPVTAWEARLAPDADAVADHHAFAEAVDFLMRQAPLPPLQSDEVLGAAALEHVSNQGPVGQIGHSGAAGERFDARLRRHGLTAEIAAENIAYGPATPSDVVRALIIDAGVASRGHRRNIFHAGLASAGVSCGPHRDYGVMCVMDFAGSAPQRALGWRQASLATEASASGGGGLLSRLFGR